MKKLNKILSFAIVFATIFSVPLLPPQETYADISAPYTYAYDVIVTNPNGAKADDYGKNTVTIPEGTRLTIEYEYTDGNSETIMVISHENGDYGNYRVKASDVDYAEKDFDMSSVPRMDSTLSQYILTDESYLYKGPNERYGRNDDNYHLPSGIVVSSSFYDGVWMYVEYDGHTGWIYYYNIFEKHPKTANIATDEWTRSFITTRNKIELKDSPYEDGQVIATINVEPLSEIPVTYYFSTGKFSSEVYIVYGQYSGWYHKDYLSYDIAIREENKTGMTIKEVGVTNAVDSSSVVSAVPANTEFKILYTSNEGLDGKEGKSYIKVNSGALNTEGWIDNKEFADSTYYQGSGYRKKTLDYDQQIFNVVNGESVGTVEPGAYYALYYYTVPSGDNNTANSETWYYLAEQTSEEDKNSYDKIGWIKSLTDDEIKELEKKRREELEALIANEEPEEIAPVEKPESPKDQTENILLWFLIGAGLISIAIIISLLIIKKRKQNNKGSEETSEKSEPANEKPEETGNSDADDKNPEEAEESTEEGISSPKNDINEQKPNPEEEINDNDVDELNNDENDTDGNNEVDKDAE